MATNIQENTSKPKVSIVIPVYNRAELVNKTIMSALAQTYTNLEIIVVDDGSTDNTREAITSFKDPRINYIYQENAGVSVARNTGIRASKGIYISFLDSDDILLEKATELSVAVLEENQQAAFSYGKAYLMDDKQRIFGLRRQREKGSYVRDGREEIRKAILHGNHVPTSTIMVRHECLNKVGLFDTSFKGGSEDFDLWVRLALHYQVAYINEPLISYRMHHSSISRTQRLAEIEKNNSIILEKIFNNPESGRYFSDDTPNIYMRLYLRLARYARGNREMAISRKYLFKAIRIKPRWFLKRLWIPLIYRYCLTLIPLLILDLGHNIKHLLRMMILRLHSKKA
jgi:glycosyltransferase involved in cell wall biosynthesis